MKKLNFTSPIGGTGYGIAGINILSELQKTHDTSLFLIGQPLLDNNEQADLIQKVVMNQDSFDFDAPCLKIWHQFDLSHRIGRGKLFAYPFFELDTFTDREKHHLHHPDHIIVSSEWAKGILKANKIKTKASVAPLGVDRTIFNESKVSKENLEKLPYIFLTVGKWEKRKGHDILVEAFNEAFTDDDNVELWMATHNPFLNEEQTRYWTDMCQSSKLSKKIKIFNRLKTHENVAELMSYASCGVFVSRAEGWNLELLEMMSMGKPVIATNYSSHTEFCNKDNAYLVETTELEPAFDDRWFKGEGNWAKINDSSKEQIVEHMRLVYKNSIRDNAHGIETAKKFSWANSASVITKILEENNAYPKAKSK